MIVADWFEIAECRGIPNGTEIFFPDIPIGDVREFYWTQARQICSVCKVKQQCLEFQLEFEKRTGRRDGMWGGMTPQERSALCREPSPIRFRR